MTVARAGNYTDGEDDARGSDVAGDLDTLITWINAHAVSDPIGHAAGSVGTTALAALAVNSAKLASNAVTSAKIADGQIVASHLAAGRAYSHTGGGDETAQGGSSGVYIVTTDATNADGSVIKDDNNLTADDDAYAGMTMVVLTCANDATIIGYRYVIASNSKTGKTLTLATAALGGGNLGVSSPLLAIGDTFEIVKSIVRAVHIGDNEVRTEHILDGEITPAKAAAGVAGYHGFLTRIKLLPTDFVKTHASAAYVGFVDEGGLFASVSSSDPVPMIASVIIPSGYKATEVMAYGNDANNEVYVFANEIDDDTTETDLVVDGHGHVGTVIDVDSGGTLTPLTATATNYLSIRVGLGGNDRIYGGYVTIEIA